MPPQSQNSKTDLAFMKNLIVSTLNDVKSEETSQTTQKTYISTKTLPCSTKDDVNSTLKGLKPDIQSFLSQLDKVSSSDINLNSGKISTI